MKESFRDNKQTFLNCSVFYTNNSHKRPGAPNSPLSRLHTILRRFCVCMWVTETKQEERAVSAAAHFHEIFHMNIGTSCATEDKRKWTVAAGAKHNTLCEKVCSSCCSQNGERQSKQGKASWRVFYGRLVKKELEKNCALSCLIENGLNK